MGIPKDRQRAAQEKYDQLPAEEQAALLREYLKDMRARYLAAKDRVSQIAGFRVRLAVWRLVLFVVVVYAVNVVLNLLALVYTGGLGALRNSEDVSQALFLNAFGALAKQPPLFLAPELLLAFSAAGVTVLAVCFIQAREGFAYDQGLKYLLDWEEALRAGRPAPPAPEVDRLGCVPLIFALILGSLGIFDRLSEQTDVRAYAEDEGDLLRQIKDWLRADPFLLQGTKQVIRELRPRGELTLGLRSTMLAIIGSRLLLLLAHH
jgi:hypothetical protein